MNITCDENHIYRVDGIVKPGATEILSGLGMIDLYGIPVGALEDGRERGSEVHEICEDFDRGILKIETVDERLAGYFKAWLKFLKEMKPEILEIEKRVYSRTWDYCGKFDRIARIQKNIILLDLKTSLAIAPATPIQLWMYKIPWEEMGGIHINDLWEVQLRADGGYQIIYKDKRRLFIDPANRSTAMSAVGLYHWKNYWNLNKEMQYEREHFAY